MKTNITYTNEFTGEVFSDKAECIRSEAASKVSLMNRLIEDMELMKDICNSKNYCEDCPFDHCGDCIVEPFTDNYLNIVRSLQKSND